MSNRNQIAALFAPALAFVATIAVVVGVACGGGGDDEPEATATAERQATEAEPTSAAGASIRVGEEFWHAGWHVTLGDATLGGDSLGVRTVAIDATFENLGDRTASFNSQVVLTSGGNSFGDTGVDEDIPNVPAGLSNDGLIAIQVDGTFSLDDATLTVGNPNNNQAIIPIGPESADDLVTLEPLEIAATGSSAAGPVAFTVTGVEVRADLPDWLEEVEDGHLAMIVSFEVTPQQGIPLGEGVLQSQHVALLLPDGTAVAVRSDGRSGVNELLQGREGTTIRDLSVRFIVDEPVEGRYTFLVRGPYGADRAMVEGEVAFDVPEF